MGLDWEWPEFPARVEPGDSRSPSAEPVRRIEVVSDREGLPSLAELAARRPKDTLLTQKLTTLQAWFGKDADHAATCRRILELAAETDDPSVADRAAKAYCLHPSSDAKLLEAALTLARRAVDLGKKHEYLPYYQMALGMAEYRNRSYVAADQALATAEQTGKDKRQIHDSARLFHAMSLFQQGREAAARQLFSEARTNETPTRRRTPATRGRG